MTSSLQLRSSFVTTAQCVTTTEHVWRAEESACALKAGQEISVKVLNSMIDTFKIRDLKDWNNFIVIELTRLKK